MKTYRQFIPVIVLGCTLLAGLGWAIKPEWKVAIDKAWKGGKGVPCATDGLGDAARTSKPEHALTETGTGLPDESRIKTFVFANGRPMCMELPYRLTGSNK